MKKKPFSEHIEDFRVVHGDTYTYPDQDIAEASKTKIDIICKNHGTFKQTISHHKSGRGCPYCSHREVTKEGSWAKCEDGVGHIITSRKSAKNNGAGTYFTNIPCLNSHLTIRRVSTGACVKCAQERGKQRIDYREPSQKSHQGIREVRRQHGQHDPADQVRITQA